jgi:hypothetical protein
VFLTRGASLRIEDLTFDLNNPNNGSMTLKIGYDVYPLWLTIAAEQAQKAETFAAELDKLFDGSGTDLVTELLEKETSASMAAIVASAAAVDAFYGSTLSRGKEIQARDSKSRRTRGRHKIITSTLQQRYKINASIMTEFTNTLQKLFEFRHMALHAHGTPEEALLHPRLNVGLSKKHVIFRAENAINSVRFVLNAIGSLVGMPKQKYKDLTEHCEYARTWVYPILDEWEKTQPDLSVKRVTSPDIPV